MEPSDTQQLPALIDQGEVTSDQRVLNIVPAIIARLGDQAGWRYVEFFTANIRNPHTRRAYARACSQFFGWCEQHGLSLTAIRPRGAGWAIRLHEKGGKYHAMPCHHALAEALHAYINAAGITKDRKAWLFRTARGHNGTVLSDKPMSQPDAWRMIRRRAKTAG